MKIKDIVEGTVTSFPNRKKELFRDKIKGIADSMPAAFQLQDEAEKLAKEMVEHFKHTPDWNQSKFANVYIMSQYVKGMSPLETLLYSLPTFLDEPSRWEKDEKLAAPIIEKYHQEIIQILKNDSEQLKKDRQAIEDMNPPALNYAIRPFGYATHWLDGRIWAVKELIEKG